MRYSPKPEFITTETVQSKNDGIAIVRNQVTALYLPADFVSEHEWGIKGLQNMFGIDEKAAPGIARRTINNVPQKLCYKRWSQKALLVLDRYQDFNNDESLAKIANRYSCLSSHKAINAAWSDNAFGVLTTCEQNSDYLQAIYEAIQRKDVAVYIGGGSRNPFNRGGLLIAVVSAVPQEQLDQLRNHDEDADKLAAADESTGIKNKIHHSKYFALSPKWLTPNFKSNNRDVSSKYPVIYWLNPTRQDKNNFGWFTVEELELWLEGKGPIPK
jgi:hypothetical protein